MGKTTDRNSAPIGTQTNLDRNLLNSIVPRRINYTQVDTRSPSIIFSQQTQKGRQVTTDNFEKHPELDYENKERCLDNILPKKCINIDFGRTPNRDKHYWNSMIPGYEVNKGKRKKRKGVNIMEREVDMLGSKSTIMYDKNKQKVDPHHAKDVHDFSHAGRDNVMIVGQLPEKCSNSEILTYLKPGFSDKPKIKGYVKMGKKVSRKTLNKRDVKDIYYGKVDFYESNKYVDNLREKKVLVNMKKTTGRESKKHLGDKEYYPHLDYDVKYKEKNAKTTSFVQSGIGRTGKKSVKEQVQSTDILIGNVNRALYKLRNVM